MAEPKWYRDPEWYTDPERFSGKFLGNQEDQKPDVESPRLRGRPMVDMWRTTWEIFKDRFGVLLLISAVLVIPAGWLDNLADDAAGVEVTDLEAWPVTMVSLLLVSLALALCTHVALAHIKGVRLPGPTLVRVFLHSRFFKVFGAALLVELAFSGCLLLLNALATAGTAVPGPLLTLSMALCLFVAFAIVLVRFFFVLPVVVAENRSPFNSLMRSWRLVRGHYWWTVGVGMLTPILLIVAIVFWMPEGIVRLLGTIFAPFWAIWVLVMYLELRTMHDGIGLEDVIDSIALPAD